MISIIGEERSLTCSTSALNAAVVYRHLGEHLAVYVDVKELKATIHKAGVVYA